MKDLTKFIKFFLQLACLVAVDLSAFYTSLFIAWIIRAEFMPFFIPGLPVFPLFIPLFHIVMVGARSFYFLHFL